MEKTVILIIGKSNFGKSSTLYELFKKRVRTPNKHTQALFFEHNGIKYKCDNVMFINGSFEELSNKKEVRDKKRDGYKELFSKADFTLCNVQHIEIGKETVQFFLKEGYKLKAYWLTSGYKGLKDYDNFLFGDLLEEKEVIKVDASKGVTDLVKLIKDYLIENGLVQELDNR